MRRLDALAAVYPRIHDSVVVTIMGAVAAELQSLGHRPNFFYLQHAMGLARYRPKNLVHVVFDNESLLSVGGFPTATATGSDLAAIAAAAGVPRTATVRTLAEFTSAFDAALGAGDLSTIVAKVEAVGPAGFVTDLAMLENRFEFQRWLRQR
jgi:sulfopyruvate decarboxylase subunit beta